MAYVVVRYTHFPHGTQLTIGVNEAAERGHGPDIQLLTAILGRIVEYVRWLLDCDQCTSSPATFLEFIKMYAIPEIDIDAELKRLDEMAPEDDPESQDMYMKWVREWALRAFARKAQRLGYRVYELYIDYDAVDGIQYKSWRRVYFPLVEVKPGLYITADWSPHDYGNVLHFIFITTDIKMPLALRYIKTALMKMQEVPDIANSDELEDSFYNGRAELIYFADSGRVVINTIYTNDDEE